MRTKSRMRHCRLFLQEFVVVAEKELKERGFESLSNLSMKAGHVVMGNARLTGRAISLVERLEVLSMKVTKQVAKCIL